MTAKNDQTHSKKLGSGIDKQEHTTAKYNSEAKQCPQTKREIII